nr:ABC transporter transmembrane domain-containing protein [Bacillus ectoiniformans]
MSRIFLHPVPAGNKPLPNLTPSSFKTKQFIKGIIKDNRSSLVFLLVISYLIVALGILNSFFFKTVVDYFIPEREIVQLNTFALLFAGLGLILAVFSYVRAQAVIHFSNKVEINLASSYFQQLMSLPSRFFHNRSSGELISRYNDALYLRELLSRSFVGGVLDLTVALVLGVVLYFVSPLLFVVTIIGCLVFLCAAVMFIQPIKKRVKRHLEEKANTQTSLYQFLSNEGSLKSLGKREYAAKRIMGRVKSQQKSLVHLRTLENISVVIKQFIMAGFMILIVWMGAREIIFGQMTIGDLIFFLSILGILVASISSLVNLQVDIQEAGVALERFRDILEYPEESQSQDESIEEFKQLEVHSLLWRPNLNQPVFYCPHFILKRGELVWLQGGNGSGKSSFSKVLAGLWEVEQGCLFYNGKDAANLDLTAYRSAVAYVDGEPFFFTGSLLDNLLMGSEVEVERLDWALTISGMKDFVSGLPGGVQEKIHEKDARFSAGQKQKLNLARVLLTDKQVIILDEAMSNIDQAGKEEILRQLLAMNKTVVYISHDHAGERLFHKCYEFTEVKDGRTSFRLKQN